MTRAVKQLAEIHVEVAQKRVNPIHVTQGDAQVAAVFAGPGFKPEDLAVAQPGPERLTSLQVLMRHGAQRREAQLHGQQHIAGAGKLPCRIGA